MNAELHPDALEAAKQVLREQLRSFYGYPAPQGVLDRLAQTTLSVYVTRTLADTRLHRRNSKTVAKLAEMGVGESLLFPEMRDVTSLSAYRKVAARELMGDDQANWTARTTTLGIRITRTR